MEEDHTRAVQIVTWFTVITSILAVITRVITKITTVHSIKLNDYVVSAALVRAPANTLQLSQALAYRCHLAFRHRTDSCGGYSDLSWLRQTTEGFKPG